MKDSNLIKIGYWYSTYEPELPMPVATDAPVDYQVVDYLRKKAKREAVALDDTLLTSDDDPQLEFERKLDIEQLALATKKLTRAQQEVISLRFAGELPIAQVAKVMGRSEGAVKALQHSAVVALRRVLTGIG